MKAFLITQRCWQAIEPPPAVSASISTTPSTGDGETSATVALTTTATQVVDPALDALAVSYILLNTHKSMMRYINKTATAKQAWDSIIKHGRSQAEAAAITLYRDLTNLSLQRNETISTYIDRAVELHSTLMEAGETISDDELKKHILFGLPSSFDVAIQLIRNQPSMDIPEVQAHLMATQELLTRRTKQSSGDQPGKALTTTNAADVTCAYCKRRGHHEHECRTKKRQQQQRRGGKRGKNTKETCGYCHKPGHSEDRCYSKLNAEKKANPQASPAVAFTSTATGLLTATKRYDPEDFQLEDKYFNDLDAEYGPFDIDGAASPDGSNSHCDNWCSKEFDFCSTDISGMHVYLNAPFKSLLKFLRHYLQCKQKDPFNTSGVFVVPVDFHAAWWPMLEGMQIVRYWPAGTQLFTLPGVTHDAPRRRLRPCHFPVAVYYDAPATVATSITPAAYKTALSSDHIVIDSGASHHMSPCLDWFIDIDITAGKFPTHVEVASGSQLPVRGIGTVRITSHIGDEDIDVDFHNVLYVPQLGATLISLRCITSCNATVEFCDDDCFIRSSGQQILHAAVSRDDTCKHGNLYLLQHWCIPSMQSGVAYAANSDSAVDLWHNRLGHLSHSGLAQLARQSIGIHVKPNDFIGKSHDGSVCEHCMAGRQTRLPHKPSETERSTTPLHRLHVDLCGPMHEESLSGSRYYLLVIDEATRFSALQPIANKSDAADRLLILIDQLERRAGTKVVNIRSDRGGEFINEYLTDELNKRGIKQELTAAYNPEGNGVAERANRTIMEKVRSMMSWSGLPPEFWGECAAHANMLRNVSPVRGSDKTPWELFFGHPPDLSYLRTFGALAHVHIPKQHRRKLDPKSHQGVLLGTDMKAHTYRVFIDNHIEIVRDVVVDETKPAWAVLYPDADEIDYGFSHEPLMTIHSGITHDNSHSTKDADDQDPLDSTKDVDDLDPLDSTKDISSQANNEDETSSQRSYPQRIREPIQRYGSFVSHMATSYTAAVKDPDTVQQAKQSANWPEWHQAMQEEYDALVANDTFTLVPSPPGVKPLPCRWVLKTKFNPDGSIDRYKARLVAGGHRQKEGIDFAEVYAPVSKFATLRALLALTAHDDMHLHSVDISNAFLNGKLDTPVYMQQPEEFSNGNPNMCYKLNKTLYGLKQAPKEWYNVLTAQLNKLGFQPSDNDQALWIKSATTTNPAVYITTWVDDELIACKDLAHLESVKKSLLTAFKGRDLGPANTYLNMVIERDRTKRTLKISQPSHVDNILSKFNMQDCNANHTPIGLHADISTAKDADTPLDSSVPYAECVGALMYISSCTRPDIAYAVSTLARAMSKPTQRHWTIAKGVLRYLSATKSHGITYGLSDLPLQGWTDSDYAACKDSRKSRSGHVFTLYGGAITWSSKLQTVIALSTAEAEYIAASHAAREAVWLKRICNDIGIKTSQPVPLFADNQAAIHMAANSADNARTKHIDVCFHFLRHNVARGTIRLVHSRTDDNPADMFTKAMPRVKLEKFDSMIGVIN